MQNTNLSKNLDKSRKENIRENIDISERIIEPLFVISVLVFLLSVVKPFIVEANPFYPVIFTTAFLILGILSSYFAYIHFKKVKNYYLMGVPILIFIAALFSFHGWKSAEVGFTWRANDFNVFGVVIGIYLIFYISFLYKFLSKETAAVLAVVVSVFFFHLVPATDPYLTSGDSFDSHWHYKIINHTYTNEHVIEHDNLVYPKITDPEYYASIPKERWKLYDGLDYSTSLFLHAVFMASTAKILSPLGINQYDVAMLFGGLIAGFAILLFYLFLREIFSPYTPYNKLVGLIGAFCLGFNFLYSLRSISGSCEASQMGLMFMAAALYVSFRAVKSKSLRWALIAGATFFFWSITWVGYLAYGVYAVGLFAVLYSLVKFLHKENTFSHVPYIIIPLIFPLFNGVILHPRGALPTFNISTTYMLIIVGAIVVPLILEVLRLFLIKSNIIAGCKEHENKEHSKLEMVNLFIERRLNSLPKSVLGCASIGIIVFGLIGVIVFSQLFIDPVIDAVTVAGKGIVLKTVAEQIGMGDFTNYGILFLYGLVMIPLLSYLVAGRRGRPSLNILIPIGIATVIHYLIIVVMSSSFFALFAPAHAIFVFILFAFFNIIVILILSSRFSPEGGRMGALVILILSVSGLWAFFNVPQLGVNTVLGVIALGATVGLIAGRDRKSINGLRVIGTFAVLIIPFFTFPFVFGDPPYNLNYKTIDANGREITHTLFPYFSPLWHSSTAMLHQGRDNDWDIGRGINWWMPALQWLNENTSKRDIILTWWDYGHWITPIAGRPVLIDNLQAVHWQLQEVARFFTLRQTEEEAMKLIERYPNIKYIVLDYTLIGKNQALRFIAQGNLSREGEKEYEEWLKNPENPNKNALSVCFFRGKIDTIEKSSAGGNEEVSRLYFDCSYPQNKTQRKDYIGRIEFSIAKRTMDINVPDRAQIYVKNISVLGLTDQVRPDGQPVIREKMSWNEWKKNHNGSLLGIQPFNSVIMCVMRDDIGDAWWCRLPMFREFVYAPNEFQNHMFTRLYLGEHAESYAQVGLCNADWCKNPAERLKNWKLVWDNNLGYIRIWKLAMHCKNDNDCDPNQYCDETMHCVDKKKENETCIRDAECETRICEGNICRKERLKNVSCLEKYNISEDTVAFYYSDGCPHCEMMKPWIRELENKGYKFLWINAANAEKMKIAQECLADILNFRGGVPQFACSSNKKLKIGRFIAIEDMQIFADECRMAAEKK